jgi:peptidoglycan/LPS O-acetylase OafA/YrhL
MENVSLGNQLLGRTNNFDFIRFIASVMVIFAHSFVLTPFSHEPLMIFTSDKYDLGYISVAVFFIISGFLITKSYLHSKSLTQYLLSRVLRIYPALTVVILITVFILGPILTTYSLKQYFASEQTTGYISNIISITSFFRLPGVFTHNYNPYVVNASIWTLPNEIACYFLVAIIGLFLSKRFKSFFVLLLVFLIMYYNKLIYQSETMYVQFIYFACGSLFFILRERVKLRGLLALVCMFVLFIDLHFSYHAVSLAAKLVNTVLRASVLSYLILYLAFFNATFFQKFSKYGDFSYGLYIWAWPVQQIISQNFKELNVYVFFFISFCLTFILAAFSWHLIEKKALALKNYFKRDLAVSSIGPANNS